MGGNPTPGKQLMQNKNVYGGSLHIFSTDPPTGHYRDGFCRTGSEDSGNHSVAATVTQEFLDFTASKGNNLSKVGLKPGTKWCLCASRWKEAMQAAKSANDPVVPKVSLHATATEALRDVEFKDLKKYAMDQETSGAVSGSAPRGMAGAKVEEAGTTGGRVGSQHPEVRDGKGEDKYSKEKGKGESA